MTVTDGISKIVSVTAMDRWYDSLECSECVRLLVFLCYPLHCLLNRQKESLYVFDPKALHHIVVKDQSVYQRAPFSLA